MLLLTNDDVDYKVSKGYEPQTGKKEFHVVHLSMGIDVSSDVVFNIRCD